MYISVINVCSVPKAGVAMAAGYQPVGARSGARAVWRLGNHAYDVPAALKVNDYLHLWAGALDVAGNVLNSKNACPLKYCAVQGGNVLE